MARTGKKHIDAVASLKKASASAFALVLACGLTAGLQGCKYTDVLTEHIEDQDNGTLDASADPLYKENPDAERDEDRKSTEIKDSDRTDSQKEEIPVYDKDAEENGTAIYRTYNPESSHTEPATVGTLSSEGEGTSQKTDEKKDKNKKKSGTKSKKNTSKSKSTTSGGNTKGKSSGKVKVSAGIGGTGTSYDTTGKKSELPENCNKVAAAGPYATIVEMLGGKGGLVATDSSWKKTVKSRGLFPDEDTSEIATAWTGSMDDGYKLNVSKLIEAEPDAVLVDGEHVKITKAQKKKLTKAKIDVVTLPSLGDSDTTDSYIVDTVNTVGELLKKSTAVTYDTQTMASNYETMHDSAITDTCLKANGGYTVKSISGTSWAEVYQDDTGSGSGKEVTNQSGNRITTVLVDSWTAAKSKSTTANRQFSGATLEYLNGKTVDTSDGIGLSSTASNNRFVLIDYYFQVSGVVNNAYDDKRPKAEDADGGSSNPCIIAPGSSTGLAPSSFTAYLVTHLWSAMWYTPNSSGSDSTWLTVGDSEFPGMVAKTTDIAKSIVTSADKTDGLYNVGQSYKVWVMPSGIDGSWADGTVESYLSSVWTLKTIVKTSGASSTCDDYVNQFYTTFYRCKSGAGTKLVKNYKKSYTAECPTE